MTNDEPEALYAAPSDDGWHAPYCGCAPSDGAIEYIRKDVADAAVEAEREACAKACEDAAYDGTHPLDDMAELGCLRARDRIRAQVKLDVLVERDARVRAEALGKAAEAWNQLRYVAVQNTNDPGEWAALIARMDAALFPAGQDGDE